MICPYCRRSVPDNNLFCTGCGARMQQLPLTRPPQQGIPSQRPLGGSGVSYYDSAPEQRPPHKRVWAEDQEIVELEKRRKRGVALAVIVLLGLLCLLGWYTQAFDSIAYWF